MSIPDSRCAVPCPDISRIRRCSLAFASETAMRSPPSRLRRISRRIARSSRTSLGVARAAALRAPRLSSAARTSRISTASASPTRRTRAPRLRSRSTRPSCSSRTKAMRTAARPRPSRRARSSSTRRSVGRSSPATIASRSALYPSSSIKAPAGLSTGLSTKSVRSRDCSRPPRERPMAARDKPPYRADHVGSLLRPPEVLKGREDRAAGRISDDDLRAIEDDAIREVIRRQEEAGLKSVTDGEFRRESWHMDFIYQLGGVTQVQDDTIHVHFENAEREYDGAPPSAHVTSTVTLPRTIFAEHFEFLRDNVRAGTPKLTIPSPSMVHYRGGRSAIDSSVYPDLDEFWADLTAAYAQQVRALAELGCTYLQLDDTSLAYVNDPKQREHIAEIGGDPEHQHEAYIANINRAIADRPEGLSITTHMCRGNNQSMWGAAGSYDFVADALFNQLEVDGFFMEWDDERSGGFEPLRYVPKGKTVVLGLVTTKRPALEDKDMLKRRIEEASRHVDADQLCLSPQCGFSSTEEGNKLSIEDEAAKLRLIVEVAEEVWGA